MLCRPTTASILGFANIPPGLLIGSDACVLNVEYFGDPEFSGSTFAHETGHWLGLFHTFSGCEDDGENGDYVDDTPALGTPSSTLYGSAPYCPGQNDMFSDDYFVSDCLAQEPIMVQNCMDYNNNESCVTFFTKGQIQRVRTFLILSDSRNRLNFSPGLSHCEDWDCSGKECGYDGCDGVCGRCDRCFDGTCVDVSENLVCSTADLVEYDPLYDSVNYAGVSWDETFAFNGDCGDQTYFNSLWYNVVVTDDNLRLTITTTGYATNIALFSGDCDSLTCLSSETTNSLDVVDCLVAGDNLFVLVSDAEYHDPLELLVDFAFLRCNDICSAAIEIGLEDLPFTDASDNLHATNDLICNEEGGSGLWYYLNTGALGLPELVIDTCQSDSDVDTALYVTLANSCAETETAICTVMMNVAFIPK